jgi:glycosidase
MTLWPKYPILYEINTWVWLHDLTQKYQRPIQLGNVPAEEWDTVASLKIDAVWLMGVWERSPASVRIAMANEGLVADFRRALPDFTAGDNIGSAYSVRRYVVDKHLGGPEGLTAARRMLSKRGLRLMLDFVPNHVAVDHPWVSEHPEYLVQGRSDDLKRDPDSFIPIGGKVFAWGRDPYFPAWKDVLQLNAFAPGLRRAAIETVSSIAGQCDGIRCDMAMLLLNQTFERTWGCRGGYPAGKHPETEYWQDVIQAVQRKFPDFLKTGISPHP